VKSKGVVQMRTFREKIELRKLRYMVDFVFAKIQERMTTDEFLNLKRVRLDVMKELGDMNDEEFQRSRESDV
jgi:hypothetical protein